MKIQSLKLTCTAPRVLDQPPGESPPWDLRAARARPSALAAWAEPRGAAAKAAARLCAGAVCAFWVGVAPVSSSMVVSCEPPRTEEEFESGGTDPDTQLGAGLLSPEALGGVWTCVGFFLRSVSIQPELCLDAKLAKAREERRMFFPEVISSPNPSWWAKA